MGVAGLYSHFSDLPGAVPAAGACMKKWVAK